MKKWYIIIGLCLLGYLLHRPFFDFTNTLFSTDRTYRPESAIKELFFRGLMTRQSQHGFGSEYIQPSFFGFKWIWGVLGNYETASRITFFIPLALLSFISPFLLSCFLTKDNLVVATVSSLFYGTMTYLSIKSTAHLPIAMIFVLTPLLMKFFLQYLQTCSWRDLLLFNILYFICIIYEIRITVIITCILGITFLFFFKKDMWRQVMKGITFTILIQLGLNAYRLLPILHLTGDTLTQTTSRGLFGNHLFNLSYALTAFENSWTGALPNQEFIPQKIPLYMWFYPCMVLIGLFFTKNKNRKLFLRGCSLFFCGVLLTKQSANPFPWLYQWLYNHVPGFNLFREASKFYQITGLAYLIMLSVTWNELRNKHKPISYILLSISLCISGILSYPLVTGSLQLMRTPKIIPGEYTTYNTFQKNAEQGKTLWIPFSPNRATYSINQPAISFSSVSNSLWKGLYEQNSESLLTEKTIQLTNELLDRGNINRVGVPLHDVANQDRSYELLNTTPEAIKKQLDTLPFLQQLALPGIGAIHIYQNTGMYGEIFSASTGEISNSCTYVKVKSSEVRFSCSSATSAFIFAQQHNTQRGLYVGAPHWREYLLRGNKLVGPTKEYDGLMRFAYPIEQNKQYTLYFLPEARFMLGVYISLFTCLIFIGGSIYIIKKK